MNRLNTIFLLAAALLASCSDSSYYIGVLPDNENLTTTTEMHGVYTESLGMDSVSSRSMYSYLGKIYDPETNGLISSSYATQFHMQEGVQLFPDKEDMMTLDSKGEPCCDSVLLTLTFDKYYGDYNTPLKLAVYPLDRNNPLCEDSVYFTSTDLDRFVDPAYRNKPLVTKVFSAYDRTHSYDPDDAASSNWPSIRIPLPNSVGDSIMTSWYKYLKDNKGLSADSHINKSFDDSYHFIRSVMPGFLVKIKSGEGTMIRIFADNLYMMYNAVDTTDTTSLVDVSYTRISGTPEVIQCCSYTQSDVSYLIEKDNGVTWLKTPASICTKLSLNIDSVLGRRTLTDAQIAGLDDDDTLFLDKHYSDSISRIQLVLQRYNKEQTDEQFGVPQTLLLIPDSEVDTFFVKSSRTADAQTTYVSSFDDTYNCYEFSNIGRLYSSLYRQRDAAIRKQLKDSLGVSEPTNRQIYLQTKAWTAAHPGWDDCLLIPVETSTNTTTSTVTSINHDLSLSSARLVRGTRQNPIKIQVYYVSVNNTKDQ